LRRPRVRVPSSRERLDHRASHPPSTAST
jgi:hypothetical protein